MIGDVEVGEFAAIVAEDDEDEEKAEGEGGDNEEVDGDELSGMRGEKGARRPPRERAEAAIGLAQTHGFSLVLAWATTLLGLAMAREGQVRDEIATIRRGAAAARANGSEQFQPYFLALLADACATAGWPADGLTAVAEVLATAAKTGERFYEAELYRLKGELLWRCEQGEPPVALAPDHAPGGPDSPEEHLLKALDIAREQGARSLELRAVVSLSRVWGEHGREADARRMLVAACGGFTDCL